MVRQHERREAAFVWCRGLFDEPRAIVLDVGDFVWVHASYADTLPADVRQVGDGRSNGYDAEGNRIVSVPIARVTEFLTTEEAEQVFAMQDADDRLLGYMG
jgi:hypothetical protein